MSKKPREKKSRRADKSGWTAARVLKLAREARIEAEKRDPKKPARRFVVGYVTARGMRTTGFVLSKKQAIADRDGLRKHRNWVCDVYELVRVLDAGGSADAKR